MAYRAVWERKKKKLNGDLEVMKGMERAGTAVFEIIQTQYMSDSIKGAFCLGIKLSLTGCSSQHENYTLPFH